MLVAQESQKVLLKKRDFILNSSLSNQKDALLITHEIAKLRDFIKFAENTLKMSDQVLLEITKMKYKGLRLDKTDVYVSSDPLKLNNILEEKID